MSDLLLIWSLLLGAVILFAVGKPGTGGALVLTYFLGISLIHVPGALIYLNPQAGGTHPVETELGFTLTVIGMAAFVCGAVVTRWFMPVSSAVTGIAAAPELRRHTWPMIIGGLFAYFVVLGSAAAIPSGTALVSALGTLIIIGLWLRFYTGCLAGKSLTVLSTLFMLSLLPVATLSAAAFLGYGIFWSLAGLMFLFMIASQRFWFYLLAPFFGFLGLSFFGVYFALRGGLRILDSVANATTSDRLSAIWNIVSSFQLLDLSSPLLITALDQRLNQNYLVGYAAERVLAGDAQLAYGATIHWWSIIPRAVWPDKPEVGGSGDIVSQMTGLEFAQGTSVGAGQVLEFYMNFGTLGLILGFFGLGVLLMKLDIGIVRSLKNGDVRSLLLFAMPGLTLLQPQGSLDEIIVATVGALVMSRLLLAAGFFAPAPRSSGTVPNSVTSVGT